MTINIERLEELARKATEAWPKQAVRVSVPGSVPTEVVNLWVTCTPSNVLALCEVARAAKIHVEAGAAGYLYGQNELREALAELEGT